MSAAHAIRLLVGLCPAGFRRQFERAMLSTSTEALASICPRARDRARPTGAGSGPHVCLLPPRADRKQSGGAVHTLSGCCSALMVLRERLSLQLRALPAIPLNTVFRAGTFSGLTPPPPRSRWFCGSTTRQRIKTATAPMAKEARPTPPWPAPSSVTPSSAQQPAGAASSTKRSSPNGICRSAADPSSPLLCNSPWRSSRPAHESLALPVPSAAAGCCSGPRHAAVPCNSPWRSPRPAYESPALPVPSAAAGRRSGPRHAAVPCNSPLRSPRPAHESPALRLLTDAAGRRSGPRHAAVPHSSHPKRCAA